MAGRRPAQILGEDLMQLPVKFDAFADEQRAHNEKIDAFVDEQKAHNEKIDAFVDEQKAHNQIDAFVDEQKAHNQSSTHAWRTSRPPSKN